MKAEPHVTMVGELKEHKANPQYDPRPDSMYDRNMEDTKDLNSAYQRDQQSPGMAANNRF